MTDQSKPASDAAHRRDELLRKALATPPISNEDIVKRAKESQPEWGGSRA